MKLTFENIADDEKWDSYVMKLPEYSFLNSSARYEFNKILNNESFRYVIFDNEKYCGIVTGSIGNSRLFGKFLECKHSPLLFEYIPEYMNDVTEFCRDIAIKNNCFMLRFSPLVQENSLLDEFYKTHGFIKAPIHNVDALVSQHVDLTKSMEELKHDMSSSRKNRLNKLLRDTSVEVKIFNDRSVFDIFKNFHSETVELKGYVDKPIDLLMKELDIQVEHGMCYMIVGYTDNIPVSIWQCTVYGKNMHLYQACSDTRYREKNMLMTTLLYWKTVELGKQLGCEVFDMFGGVVPVGYENKNHPWKGVGDFKESLGGKKITYMHSRDLPISKPKYFIYYPYSLVRTKAKGYTINW